MRTPHWQNFVPILEGSALGIYGKAAQRSYEARISFITHEIRGKILELWTRERVQDGNIVIGIV